MNLTKVVIDATIAQLPLLIVIAGVNERAVEMLLTFMKKAGFTFNSKHAATAFGFVTALIICLYNGVVLLQEVEGVPMLLNSVMAAMFVAFGSKVLHDFTEILGALTGKLKLPVSNATRSKF